MSLLELLKEHLKEWPQGVVALAQDSDGEMAAAFQSSYGKRPWGRDRHTFVWSAREAWRSAPDPARDEVYWRLPVADDARTAIVTREMWEAA